MSFKGVWVVQKCLLRQLETPAGVYIRYVHRVQKSPLWVGSVDFKVYLGMYTLVWMSLKRVWVVQKRLLRELDSPAVVCSRYVHRVQKLLM